jgi:hypothetical protein
MLMKHINYKFYLLHDTYCLLHTVTLYSVAYRPVAGLRVRAKSAIESRYQTTTGEDTAD